MKTKKYLLSTLRQKPINAESISHELMLRAGMIRKLSSGLYVWLPTGYRVIQKIKNIIKKEMEKIGSLEISMPILQPKKYWEQSKRIDVYGKELLSVLDRHKKQFVLSPTHEEIITHIMKYEIISYKQLPITVYQIQKKFRDELRPRDGVVRSVEFLMKDAYSFHLNKKSLQERYDNISNTYCNIFKKLQLSYEIIKSSDSAMGGSISHEFQTVSSIQKKNKNQKNILEIGHIFQLEKKYSQLMNLFVYDKEKKKKNIYMGCYGIGVNRIVPAIIEQHNDARGIIWPENIAPFTISIVPIGMHKYHNVKKISYLLYNKIYKINKDILFDTRNENIGTMLSDMDLIGIPHKIIISLKSLKKNTIEYCSRKNNVKKIIPIDKIIDFLIKKIKIKYI